MALYHVDLVTDQGVRRAPFTLDEDRPLTPQLRHVLEELRQSGLMLKGGPDDQLVVRWNGRDLDTDRAPRALAISPLYPVELRMVRRELIEARREPPAKPFLPKGDYLGLLAGICGGAVAWAVASLVTDLGSLGSYDVLDVVISALLGGMVGSFVLAAYALRRGESVLAGLLVGLGLGAVGAALGTFLGLVLSGLAGLGGSRQGFALARVLTWALMGGVLGAMLGLPWMRRDAHRMVDGLVGGLAAGAVGGLAYSLPSRPEFWQTLAFVLVGGGVGFCLSFRSVRRAIGVFELETIGQRSVGPLRHREWEIPRDGVTHVAPFRIETKGARCTVLAEEGATVEAVLLGEKPLRGSSSLLNEDTLAVGERKYRFRRLPG